MLLVVEDHADTRVALVRILERHGYDVVAVSSPDEAIPLLRSTKPQLVISDYSMPGMNGMALFHKIRADAQLRDVPMIIFSSHDAEVRDEALRSGIDAWVTKGSLDWAELHREVVRLAGPGRSVPKSGPTPTPRAKDSA